MLTQYIKDQITQLQLAYPDKRSALIPALHMAQEEVGYLPAEIQAEIATLFDIDVNEVHAVVTFYDMFFEKPIGKHILHVCKNVSCMLRGSDQLIEKLCDTLNICPGETTADGKFTLIACECLAACDRAPMVLADSRVIGPIEENAINSMLEEIQKGKGHPSPVTDPEHYYG